MKIIYLGDSFEHSTSVHRANALRRLGHEITHVNPRGELPRSRIVGGLSVRVGFGIFSPLIIRAVKKAVGDKKFDLAWVDAGPELGPSVYRFLRSRGIKIINYNVDDPFSTRDGRKWNLYRTSVPLHDVTVVVRSENIQEAKAAGAKNVLRVYRSYDPAAHAPLVLTELDREKWHSEVSFIGTWMPERGPFMAELIKRGVPLSIWGDWWQKAPEWPALQSAWRGYGIYGRDFVAATQSSKVAIGMLSKGNRDLHTTRTAEVPYIGGPVFCAERTNEHELLYKEGVHAIFWSDVTECASACKRLLADAARRKLITESSRERVMNLRLSNDAIIDGILDFVSGRPPGHALIFS